MKRMSPKLVEVAASPLDSCELLCFRSDRSHLLASNKGGRRARTVLTAKTSKDPAPT